MRKKDRGKIFVTKTLLPDKKEFSSLLKTIWENNWITNHGPLANRLEKKLKAHLRVPNLCLVSNGTVALEIAIKALNLKGEIITTPFSYAATTSSIVWTDCKPRFADIDRNSLNIDPLKIEKLITRKTSAILATHVYGNPCDVRKINTIAKKHGLKVIYDAAHCFGVKYMGKSILNYGDVSTMSFHATKLFHTAEGGALVCRNSSLFHKIMYSRNFGHRGEESFWGLGINGKNSELHAAVGLGVIKTVKQQIKLRKAISELYDKLLEDPGIRKPQIAKGTDYNYAYYPVIFRSEAELLAVRKELNRENIYPRRYFYPSLNTLNYVKYESCPVAENISKTVMCLPLYPDLKIKDIKTICRIINKNL
jgi:dTDP-4-amino-4,6-dideoxygalactose transaminase